MAGTSNIEKAELIIKRIQERRLELNLSYQALADRTGLSKSTLQRYETGDIMNIPLSKIDILAQGLQTSPLYLLGWEDSPNNKEAEIIEAYRKQPQLHEAVEKVLGIYKDDTGSIKERTMTFKIASREGADTIELTDDQRKEFVKEVEEIKKNKRDHRDVF